MKRVTVLPELAPLLSIQVEMLPYYYVAIRAINMLHLGRIIFCDLICTKLPYPICQPYIYF